VAFDEQIFLLQRFGGVSKYFVELIRALEDQSDDVSVELPYSTVCNEHALDAWPGRFKPARGPAQPYPQLVAAGARPRRRPSGVDVVHHTFYNSRFLRDYPGVPKVVTIYDMIPELLGERGRFGNPHMAKREYVRRASAIICISESARDDMLALYGVPDCPVEVVHLGVDPSFATGGARPAGFPERYVLFVGRRGGYKNFAAVARAFEAVAAEDKDVSLVCVGGGPLTAEEISTLGTAAGRVSQHSLPDADMPGAYANAECFVFPSRYEGFGLPAVEALAAGTPTILARTSSLPEVGGSAASYFEPDDVDGLVHEVRRALALGPARDGVVAAGRRHAAAFTWARTALQTAQVYAAQKP
jgi:glycosyltransferase involved in cell wall biosynthesis